MLFVIPLVIVLELVNTIAHHGRQAFRMAGARRDARRLFRDRDNGGASTAAVWDDGGIGRKLRACRTGEHRRHNRRYSTKLAARHNRLLHLAITTPDNKTHRQQQTIRRATLTVPKFRAASSLGEQQAPVRHAFLVLSTVWKNTGPAQYLVPDIVNHLFLLIDGDRQATVSAATAAAPHRLPVDSLVIPPTGEAVSGEYVFKIPDHGVTNVELLFIDTDQGDMHLTLFGRTPPAQRTIAGPANNGLIEAGVLGTEEVNAVGNTQAPPGQKYAVIAVRMRGLSKGNLVRFDAPMYSVLRDSDGYNYQDTQLADLDDEFTSATQLLPEVPCLGMLAFLVPASHSALTLTLNLPGYQSMEFPLPNTGGSVRIGKPLLSIEDPDTLILSVLGLRRVSSIGNNSAASGKSYLVLDVMFTSRADQGIEFQTAEQLILLDGDNQITADSDALDALPHPLKQNSVIPPHGQARFEVAYQVPAAASHFAIRYRGFQMETKESLPAVHGNGHVRLKSYSR